MGIRRIVSVRNIVPFGVLIPDHREIKFLHLRLRLGCRVAARDIGLFGCVRAACLRLLRLRCDRGIDRRGAFLLFGALDEGEIVDTGGVKHRCKRHKNKQNDRQYALDRIEIYFFDGIAEGVVPFCKSVTEFHFVISALFPEKLPFSEIYLQSCMLRTAALPLFVVFSAREYLRRAVQLFRKHNSRKLMRERHRRH